MADTTPWTAADHRAEAERLLANWRNDSWSGVDYRDALAAAVAHAVLATIPEPAATVRTVTLGAPQ